MNGIQAVGFCKEQEVLLKTVSCKLVAGCLCGFRKKNVAYERAAKCYRIILTAWCTELGYIKSTLSWSEIQSRIASSVLRRCLWWLLLHDTVNVTLLSFLNMVSAEPNSVASLWSMLSNRSSGMKIRGCVIGNNFKWSVFLGVRLSLVIIGSVVEPKGWHAILWTSDFKAQWYYNYLATLGQWMEQWVLAHDVIWHQITWSTLAQLMPCCNCIPN